MYKIRKEQLILTIITAIVVVASFSGCSEKTSPKFKNGEMVIHTLNKKEGQVIDNAYKFNGKADCWSVKVRFKSDVSKKDGIGKFLDGFPLILNEFELEKK